MKSRVKFGNEKTPEPREMCIQRVLVAVLFLVITALFMSGCAVYHGQGETAQERARRHYRTYRMNANQMVEDIDEVFMLDRPSHLTEKRVP